MWRLGKPRYLLSFLWLALVGLPALAGPVQRVIPLDEYWQRVTDTQSLVMSLTTEPPEVVSARLAAAADEWAVITGVSLPDGAIVPVDHSFLVSQLRADPPVLDQLADQLYDLQLTRQAWSQPQDRSGDLRALEAILKRPEFQWLESQPSWWTQFWRWLQEMFVRLLSWLLPGNSITGEFVGTGLTAVAGLVFAVVIFFILSELIKSFVSEAEGTLDGEQADEQLTADSAFSQAQLLSNNGDYRSAVRYLYLSALLLLDERGLLRYDRSLTNREYLQTVAHVPEVAATLREVVEVFDNVWYGYHSLDAVAFEQYAARVARLRQQR